MYIIVLLHKVVEIIFCGSPLFIYNPQLVVGVRDIVVVFLFESLYNLF